MGVNFIKWLSELSRKDVALAGGKGANLGEMYNSKFPVPQAFVVTTDAFFYFIKKTKIEDEIRSLLSRIKVDDTADLQAKSKEIRNLIISTELPQDLQQTIIEAYDHFNINLDDLKDSPGALAILRSSRDSVFVSVRSSSAAEDLTDASFAGQQESFTNIKGNPELVDKVKRVFASIFTARAIYYRKKKGFDDFVGIAAVIQKMVNSDKSGVVFSKNPITGSDNILVESVWGQGEGIVSGRIKPDQHILNRDLEILSEKLSEKKIAVVRTAGGQTKSVRLTDERSKMKVLQTYELKQLAEFAIKLEKHYENVYILQTRAITTLDNNKEIQDIDGQLLVHGLAGSPGVVSGIVKVINSMNDLDKIKQGDIIVTTMTNPDMVVALEKAAGIVTSEGGVTAHAAIVSREMGIPAVVGAQNALDVLDDGLEITIDGFNGKVFAGVAENRSVKIKPIVSTNTKIKVMVDLPKFAERAAKSEVDGIGLVRLEGLIASNQRHPLEYETDNNLEGYKDMLKAGLKEIAEQFIGKPIWIRTSDIKSDEYSNLKGAPKEIERNPILGSHGLRFSLKHEGIFRSELQAIYELAMQGHKLGVIFPQVISVEEVIQAKKIFEDIGCVDRVKFGVMIETPAAAILIKDICECGIDFISFGINDLTQYTLAIDRGNDDVQYLYDELNWAVLKQISRVIRECKKQGVETSICGQAGSNPKMIEFLIKCGIDSLSVNSDVAYEVSVLVKKLEEGEENNISAEVIPVVEEFRNEPEDKIKEVVTYVEEEIVMKKISIPNVMKNDLEENDRLTIVDEAVVQLETQSEVDKDVNTIEKEIIEIKADVSSLVPELEIKKNDANEPVEKIQEVITYVEEDEVVVKEEIEDEDDDNDDLEISDEHEAEDIFS